MKEGTLVEEDVVFMAVDIVVVAIKDLSIFGYWICTVTTESGEETENVLGEDGWVTGVARRQQACSNSPDWVSEIRLLDRSFPL